MNLKRINCFFSFIIVLIYLCSCSYHGNLKEDFYQETTKSAKRLPLSILVSNDDRNINKIKASGGLGDTYEIEVANGLIKAVQKCLSEVFQNVEFEEVGKNIRDIDFIVETSFDWVVIHKDVWAGTQTFEGYIGLSFLDPRTLETVLEYRDKRRAHVAPTTETTALSALTGASLFILSPITIPAIAQAGGKHGMNILEDTLRKSLKELTETIRRDQSRIVSAATSIGIGVTKDKKGGVQDTPEQGIQIASKYEHFLESAVVVRSSFASGTGFFVTQSGHIITNRHVVGRDSSVSIKMRNGGILIGDVFSTDKSRDLALIKVVKAHYSWLSLAELSSVTVGGDVLAIGTPKGLDWSVTKGIVSAVRKFGDITFIQTDAAINSGNSGGPLISLHNGQVIGVNTFGFRKDESEGLNFAVFSGEILNIFPQLKEYLIK